MSFRIEKTISISVKVDVKNADVLLKKNFGLDGNKLVGAILKVGPINSGVKFTVEKVMKSMITNGLAEEIPKYLNNDFIHNFLLQELKNAGVDAELDVNASYW